MLADGGRIAKTQSAVVLEKLISQFLFDKAASGPRQMKTLRIVHWRWPLALLLSACASTPGRPYDPFEASNRVMYAINEPLDKYIAKPIAQAWVDYVPSDRPTGVTNYVNNIDDLFSGVNGLLQGKLDKAGNDFGPRAASTPRSDWPA